MTLGIEWLAIANVTEGIELRKAGIVTPDILVFGCDYVDCLAETAKYNLILTIYSLDIPCKSNNVSRYSQTFHLEVDTGMGRTGILFSELSEVTALLKSASNIQLEGCFTHLACADEPDAQLTKKLVKVV